MPIRWTDTYKYLSVTLTSNHNWHLHIKDRQDKALKELNITRALCGTWWGADPTTLLTIYRNLIRSHLDFGCQFIIPSSKKEPQKLDRIQNGALRLITVCMRSTPTYALQAECEEKSLQYRRNWFAIKFINKIRNQVNHPLKKIL